MCFVRDFPEGLTLLNAEVDIAHLTSCNTKTPAPGCLCGFTAESKTTLPTFLMNANILSLFVAKFPRTEELNNFYVK